MSRLFVSRKPHQRATACQVGFTNSVRKGWSRRFARASVQLARLAFLVLLAWPVNAQIQDFSTWQYRTNGAPGFYPAGTMGFGALTNYYQNGTTGTSCNKLVKLGAGADAGKAIVTAGGETLGVIGVAVADAVHGATCGVTGFVSVAVAGQVQIIFDTASPTLNDYVGISAASGQVHDVGAAPGTNQNIGRVIRTPAGAVPSNCNSGSGCYVQLQLGSASGGGGGGGGCIGSCVDTAPVGSQIIVQPGGTNFTVQGGNFIVLAPGSINGFFGSDSGSNAGTNGNSGDNWQFSSGSIPGTQTLSPSGSWIPVWAAKVSGVTYASSFEMQANKDQINGYPSLNSTGQVPLAELIAAAGLAGCNNTNLLLGDFSGCISAGGNPGFDGITSSIVGNVNHLIIKNGGTLEPDGVGGIINANRLNGVLFNSVNAANQILVSSTPFVMQPQTLIMCKGINDAFQFDTSTHAFSCATISSGVPSQPYVCNGASNACPNTGPVVGDTNNLIAAQFTVPASQLTIGKCFRTIMYFGRTAGSGSIQYKWNIGGTGSVGTDITGGTNTSQASSSTAANNYSQLEVCAYSSTAVYMRALALQVGAAQIAPAFQDAVPYTLANSTTVSFIINAAGTESITLTGGHLDYP